MTSKLDKLQQLQLQQQHNYCQQKQQRGQQKQQNYKQNKAAQIIVNGFVQKSKKDIEQQEQQPHKHNQLSNRQNVCGVTTATRTTTTTLQRITTPPSSSSSSSATATTSPVKAATKPTTTTTTTTKLTSLSLSSTAAATTTTLSKPLTYTTTVKVCGNAAILMLICSILHNHRALQVSAAITPPQIGQSLQATYEQQYKHSSSNDSNNYTTSNSNKNPKNQHQNHQDFIASISLEQPSAAATGVAAIEEEVVNHTLKSFSIIDGLSVTATATATEVDKQPIFDFGLPRNITSRTGQTEAIIKCRVDMLNDKSVSWIRKRDLHILTVGTATYTTDKRFEVTESRDSREWTLHVKAPQARDSGIYECQVNTEPKVSMAFQLNIIEISPDAKATISGPPDLHFKVGSAIILNCIVEQPSVKDIGPIYWYRGEHMITPFDVDSDELDVSSKTNAVSDDDADADAAGAVVVVGGGGVKENEQTMSNHLINDVTQDFATRIAMESQLGDTLKSRLRISNAQTTDTGNYTCQPTTASSASVMVHVINDENPAAMQKSSAVALTGIFVNVNTFTIQLFAVSVAAAYFIQMLPLIVLL